MCIGLQITFMFICTTLDLWILLNQLKKFCRLEEATGLAFRFVIGRTSDKSKMSALKKEVAEYDDFVLLDIEEEYSKLPYKTLVLTFIIH